MQHETEHTEQAPVSLDARVRSIAEQALEDPSLFVVDVDVKGQDGSRVVEIYVDGDEGVSIGRLASLSREIGFVLETEDLIRGKYRLNVSSPGADRPFAMPRQYRKHVGRQLDVTYQHPESGEETQIKGALSSVSETALELQLAEADSVHIAFEAIKEARVALPW